MAIFGGTFFLIPLGGFLMEWIGRRKLFRKFSMLYLSSERLYDCCWRNFLNASAIFKIVID